MSKPKNVTAERLNTVTAAIKRDPSAPMPGETSTGKLHPVTEALRFLRGGYDDRLLDDEDADDLEAASEECADALEAYDAELMRGAEQANSTAKRFAAFVDAVAVAVGMEEGSDSEEVLRTLVEHFKGWETPIIANVEEVDAEAFAREAAQYRGHTTTIEPERPYFETVQGVAKVIEQHNGKALAEPLHDLPRVLSAILADLNSVVKDQRDHINKTAATMQQQSKELHEYVDPNALRQLVADFGGGWVDNPVEALREVLTTLNANQKPADFEDAVQKLVDASTRKENAIEAIKAILRLA